MKSLSAVLTVALGLFGCNLQDNQNANSLLAEQPHASLTKPNPCEHSASYPNLLSMARVETDDEPVLYKDYECLNGEVLDRNQPCPGLANPWCKTNWEPLNVGMLETEIKSLLGAPVRIVNSQPGSTTWYFQSIGSVTIMDGKLLEFDRPDKQHYHYLKPIDGSSN